MTRATAERRSPFDTLVAIATSVETCYRHPDRVTGRHCTRCGRAACPDCLRSASVGSQCVDCLRVGRPPATERLRRWDAAHPMLVTQAIIVVNVAIGLIGIGWSVSGGLNSANSSVWARWGLFGPLVEAGEWYRIITSGFIHAGAMHLAMNMLIIWWVARMLEPNIGHLRFGALYLCALVWGSAGALVVDPLALTGGASGAAFGLVAAALVGYQLRGLPLWRSDLFALLVINLLITFAVPGIAIGGHIGGLIGGGLAGLVVMRPMRGLRPGWEVPAVLGITLAGFAICLAAAAHSVG